MLVVICCVFTTVSLCLQRVFEKKRKKNLTWSRWRDCTVTSILLKKKKIEVVRTNVCICPLCTHERSPRAHKHARAGVRSNPVVVSCVNKANKECRRLEREQWVTLLSDVPLCCCCLSLQVVSYHACVCGLFLIPYLFYTLSFSMPSECRVRAVVCVCVCVA